MISKVVLAKLSPTMEEGQIVKWSKSEGDKVKVGDILAEIETDKANMEMEALAEGVLRKILVPAGSTAPVGSLIGVIAGADEDISELLATAGSASKAQEPAAPRPAESEAKTQPAATPRPAPPAEPSAGPRPSAVSPASEGGRVKASPLARRMAAERNIALAQVEGSGPGGRVIRRDIEEWSGPAAAKPAPAASRAPAAPAVTAGEEIPLSSMRRTIARRLAESKFKAPHFYVSVEIDMDAAVALREQLKQAEAKISYNDLVVKACALALRAQPMVNASWGEDRIVTHAEVNVGVAVSLPDGLITPVVRDADRKSVGAIAAEVQDLAARARDKKLKPEEFTGSTFTTSNLGMFGVTDFTAIINPPDSAILAIGAVRREPVVDGDAIRVGHRMSLTLSSDHRVIDGALAAQFLAEVRRLLESPLLLLI
jgi:pyruvate dehydrogenase E2 component (dihydrolipoamide acetyltransferase)